MGREKLVIIGATEFAEIAYEYFMAGSEYEVVAFSVNKGYIETKTLKGIPVVPLEELEYIYPPSEYYLFTAITYGRMNRLRADLYKKGKALGYRFAKYVSPYAFVWENVEIGENTFIFEDNTIQYNAKIGTGVVIWSGNHIGHSAVIEDFVFLSSHVVVSGYCRLGAFTFCGVNSTFGNNLEIPEESLVGAGTVITHSLKEKGRVYIGNPCHMLDKPSCEYLM